MSDTVILALINATPLTLTAVAAIIAAVLGVRNRASIKEIHLSLNSRLDELVKASHDSGRVEAQRDAADKVIADRSGGQ